MLFIYLEETFGGKGRSYRDENVLLTNIKLTSPF